MIDLRNIKHKSVNMVEGINTKRLITTDNGKYVFKANNGFSEKRETPTSFGEVLYSRVCKKLHCNCVNATFAEMTIGDDLSHGALIDYFWESDTLEAISYGDIVRRCNLYGGRASEEMIVDNIIALSKTFAKNWGLNFDAEKAKTDLTKLAILDYFFAQTDRHRDNVEFLINATDMKLAPIFDNGFCFNLWRMKFKGDIIAPNDLKKQGNPQYLRIVNTNCTEKEKTKDLAKQICVVAKRDPEMRKFISDIYNLDMSKMLAEVYAESDKDIDVDYVKNCNVIFGYRKHLLSGLMKKMDETKNIQVASEPIGISVLQDTIPPINNNAYVQEKGF